MGKDCCVKRIRNYGINKISGDSWFLSRCDCVPLFWERSKNYEVEAARELAGLAKTKRRYLRAKKHTLYDDGNC